MNTRKTILLAGFVVCAIIVSVGYGVTEYGLSKPSVKGVSTTISPSPTTIPTPTPTLTPTPTPTIKPISHQKQTVPQIKQYGGWYWQPDLNRAQVWVGTDSAGKDIWIDNFPTSTPTPTPKTTTQFSSSQGAVSETSGFSSRRNMIQRVETKRM